MLSIYRFTFGQQGHLEVTMQIMLTSSLMMIDDKVQKQNRTKTMYTDWVISLDRKCMEQRLLLVLWCSEGNIVIYSLVKATCAL